MIKVGVITNPRSQRNRRGFARVRRVLAGHPGVAGVETGDVADIPGIVADFARREVGLVVVNGGDGTVQAVLSALYQDDRGREAPLLAVLPGGMTNMIADDIGLRGRRHMALERLIAGAAAAGGLADHLQVRRLIRMAVAPDRPPVYGMFFGAAGIHRAIQACRGAVHPLGIQSSAAAGVTIAALVLRWVLSGGRAGGVFQGDDITVDFDGAAGRTGCYLLALVTTLERLVLGSRPFWGGGAGALRFTSVAYPPARFARSVIPLLYGGEDRALPAGDYVSRSADEVAFHMDCPFTLDGELFEPVAGTPVVLTGGREARFVRC